MSNSYKKIPISKITGYLRKDYWKIIRRKIKSKLQDTGDYEELQLPEPQEICNDYDYIDYILCCDGDCRCLKEYGRKKCLDK
jgi:hypothetical protein